MQRAPAMVNPYKSALSPGPALRAFLVSVPLLTLNTRGAPRPYDEPERVYSPGWGKAESTSNTIPMVTERPPQVRRAFSAVSPNQSVSLVVQEGFEVRRALHELRRLSGLTWESLADVLGVTRRSVHLWANGGPINSPNEKQVRDLLVALRIVDRGTATENRQLLLTPLEDGRTISDLLRDHAFDEAVAFAGRGRGRRPSAQSDVPSSTARAERISVADMLGTNPERIRGGAGTFLPARLHTKRV